MTITFRFNCSDGKMSDLVLTLHGVVLMFAAPATQLFSLRTRIATPSDEVAIDELRIGDLVITSSGKPKPIKWIGRNHYTRAPSGAWHPDVAPVMVARFALDGRTPHTDLYLSPAHALYLYGLLIPVGHLVNGRSIVAGQHAHALTLDYYHIELEDHDVVLAEGAAAETYRGNFSPRLRQRRGIREIVWHNCRPQAVLRTRRRLVRWPPGLPQGCVAPSRRSMTRASHWTGSATTLPLAPSSASPRKSGRSNHLRAGRGSGVRLQARDSRRSLETRPAS